MNQCVAGNAYSLDPGDVELVGVRVVRQGEVGVADVVHQCVLFSLGCKSDEEWLVTVVLQHVNRLLSTERR